MVFSKKWFNLNTLMYIIILLGLLLVHRIEQNDWHCHNAYQFWERCRPAEGMPYRGSTPAEQDTTSVLLDKIDNAAGAEDKSIKWRRSFIMAVICSFMIFGLVVTPGSLPMWYTFYLTVFIITGMWYFHFSNYSYHKFKSAEHNVNKATEILRQREKQDFNHRYQL